MIKRRSVPIVLLSLICFFAVGKGEAFTSPGGAENQVYCFYGGVYQKETDSCVSIFRESSPPMSFNFIQSSPVREIKVLSIAIIKQGDNCIKLTKLSLKECILLGREYGRIPLLFIAANGDKTFDVPLYVGEQIAFVSYVKNGDIRFKYIISKKR